MTTTPRDRANAAARARRWRSRNPGYKAAWRARNKDRLAVQEAAYRETYKPRRQEVGKARYEKIGPEHRAHMKAWREGNRERLNAMVADWARRYPERRSRSAANRRAAKLRARPSWANEFFIDEAYDLARRRTVVTGYAWHVDHIVPLQSKIVCGLHVESNLRVIPAQANHIKGCRWWPDMPPEFTETRV